MIGHLDQKKKQPFVMYSVMKCSIRTLCFFLEPAAALVSLGSKISTKSYTIAGE